MYYLHLSNEHPVSFVTELEFRPEIESVSDIPPVNPSSHACLI